jgi:hypothetical protein
MKTATIRVTIAPWSHGWGIFDADVMSTRMYLSECGPFSTKAAATVAVKTLLQSDWTRYVIAKPPRAPR